MQNIVYKSLNMCYCFFLQKRRTLRQTLQKQREEMMKSNSVSKQPSPSSLHATTPTNNTNSLVVNLESNNTKQISPFYRRPSLLEATTKSDCLPPPLPMGYQPPGYVPARSGRTVTWHNQAHNPDHLV